MRRVATALALSVALGGVALPLAAARTAGAGPQSIVAHPAPPDLATLLQRGNPALVCHLAHSAVRDRQDSDLALTLDDALAETRALVTPDTAPAAAVPEQDHDAVTPADVMLMIAALALASLSLLVVRG